MAFLSKRIMTEISRTCLREHGLAVMFMDLGGRVMDGSADPFGALSAVRRRRDNALQESINQGAPALFYPATGLMAWVVAMEHRRMMHGGIMVGPVWIGADGEPERLKTAEYLAGRGMLARDAETFCLNLPARAEAQLRPVAEQLQALFYQVSGWNAELMKENRVRIQQQDQINQAIEAQRKSGMPALYAFEKERILLAHIRAGDRNGARRLLNEMLATIYMSSPQLVVLRARAIELISCLTRAAIEDNPMMEPMIERNHAWTENLVKARSFEELSQVLMEALDGFIDAVYLHGANRSNAKVRQALDFISANFAQPISLRDVARTVGLSPFRLSHVVKDFTGRSVLQIIHQVRIRHAQHLLERSAKSCAEIAYEVGFSDQSYFIRHFRRQTGTTPRRYRHSREAPSETTE
jgi:AraC-like DNA-binding protein